MKQLSNLMKLAEEAGAAASGRAKVDKMFSEFEDHLENLFDFYASKDAKNARQSAVFIQDRLHSDVLKDLFAQEGFPATEANAAKKSAAKLVEALNMVKSALSELEDEMSGLHMGLGIHFDSKMMGDE